MVKRPTKYLFVTGGVLSGLGKGTTAASIGNLLKARGLKINIQKCDPYLNTDAGTLNPAEHGECFVTKDGAETDLDLGHYERFLDQELTQTSSVMAGRVMGRVLEDERNGKYLGRTVQYIPHVTEAFQEEITKAANGFDVHIVEVGGTVGDYESLSIIEAIRELAFRVGRENAIFVHVVYMPYLGASREFKTKPAQNAVRDLRSFGIAPDILVARSEAPAPQAVVNKLSLFSGVPPEAIALLPNASSIYEVPLTLEEAGVANVIAKRLDIKVARPALKDWRRVVARANKRYERSVRVGVIAKYTDNHDTYMSVFEALRSAAWANDTNLTIRWIKAEQLANDKITVETALEGCDGIVVPPGFGKRAAEGKIKAAQYAFKHKLPYLGLCLGMQIGVIATARLSGLSDANSTEFAPTSNNQVISTMSDQKGKENTGGTMRLGNYPCVLEKNSLVYRLYKEKQILERHRHRYECNNAYRDQYESWGIRAVGLSPDARLVEMIEAIDHPFFIGSQFHPEFKSRPNRAHPMFNGFIKAALQNSA